MTTLTCARCGKVDTTELPVPPLDWTLVDDRSVTAAPRSEFRVRAIPLLCPDCSALLRTWMTPPTEQP